jgi:hypothetical protein
MVATIFAQFPEFIEFADPLGDQAKHSFFSDRPDLVAGRKRVLCIRRLPAWHLSYAHHKSKHGLHPDHRPLPMDTPEEMCDSTFPDHLLSAYVEGGQVWPDRWIRVEHLVDDVLSLLEEDVDVPWSKRMRIRAMTPRNKGAAYDREVSSWFTREMIDRMYERNPLWQEAEQLAYGPTRTSPRSS